MIKMFTAVVALTSLASLPAAAEPKKMSSAVLDQVVAGTDYCPPPEVHKKGNNGWGNGADPSNAGSGSGATLLSKLANENLSDVNKINTNPTSSTGR